MRATDPYVRHWWECAATLVSQGYCAPLATDLEGKTPAQQRTLVAQAVAALAKELMTIALNAPPMDIDLS